MSYIRINKRIHIKKARTQVQKCLCCGEPMKGGVGVVFGNRDDGLAMQKTLWVHYRCLKDFGELMIKMSEQYEKKVVALGI